MKKLVLPLTLAFSMLITGCGLNSSKSENSSKVSKSSDKTFIMLKNRIEEEKSVSDLYVKYYGTDEQKLTTGISNYPDMKYISGDKSVLVLDNESNLYEYTKDGNKNKVASDVLSDDLEYGSSFSISKTNNTIAYLTNDYSLYAIYEGKDKVKVASNVSYYQVSSDGKIIYYIDYDGALYSFDSSEQKEKIKSEVSTVSVFNNGLDILFTTHSQELYRNILGSSEPVKIDDGSIDYDSIRFKNGDITYINEYDWDTGKGELFLYNSKNEKIKIASDVTQYIKINNDFYYINSENNFYKKNVKDDKSEKLASDVTYIYNVDGTIYYLNNDNDLYKSGKEAKKIGSGIENTYDVKVVNGNDILFKNKDGEIYLNSEKIISEAKKYTIDAQTLAYVNENNEVHIYDMKNKKDEVVFENAKSYSTIYYCGKFLFENTLTPEDLQGSWKYEDNYGGYALYNFKGSNKIEVYTEAGLEETYTYKVTSSTLNHLTLLTTPDSTYISVSKLDDKTIKVNLYSSELTLVKVDGNSIDNTKNNESNSESKNKDVEIANESSATSEDVKKEIAEFIEDYEYAYIDAVNAGDVYLVSDYLVYNGKLYNEHSKYIPSYYERGISETLHSIEVTKIEKINDREYRVTVNERIGIIKSGSEEIKEFDNTYVVLNNDGNFKIREML